MAGRTKIARYLKARGSNQIEAAALLEVTPATFSNKANGKTQFTQREMKKLAERYGMGPWEIKVVFF